jgi:hypothetical protein
MAPHPLPLLGAHPHLIVMTMILWLFGAFKLQVLLRGAAAATNFSLSDYRQQLAEYHQVGSIFTCFPNLRTNNQPKTGVF